MPLSFLTITFILLFSSLGRVRLYCAALCIVVTSAVLFLAKQYGCIALDLIVLHCTIVTSAILFLAWQ